MAPAPVLFYGAGHLGRQVYHHVAAHLSQNLRPLGFIDDTQAAGVAIVGGLRTVGSLMEARGKPGLTPDDARVIFTIGYSDMRQRRRALESVRNAGYALAEVIHPRAWVEPGVIVGAGTIVLAHAVLDQGVRLGEACFVDIGVRLTASTRVGTNTFICSGVSTGSRVEIGEDGFIGMDCTITTDVKIGDRVYINAKSIVPRDIGNDLQVVEVHKSREVPRA